MRRRKKSFPSLFHVVINSSRNLTSFHGVSILYIIVTVVWSTPFYDRIIFFRSFDFLLCKNKTDLINEIEHKTRRCSLSILIYKAIDSL